MDRDEAMKELRRCQRESDPEEAHKEVDRILRDLLRELGYEQVVKEWGKVKKWYA